MTISKTTRLQEKVVATNNTADVLARPSNLDYEIARKAIEQVDWDVVCRDAGAVVAREYANVLDEYAFRPANFGNMEDIQKALQDKLVETLKASEAFGRAFQDQLKMRG